MEGHEHHDHGPMVWCVVTDENGVDFNAQSADYENADGPYTAWVYTDKPSGFQDDVGRLNYKTDLKKLPDGKLGA